MKGKFNWQYYTEGNDSRGSTDPRKYALVFNAGVYPIQTQEEMFHGDIDEHRLKEIRDETSSGKSHRPDCILVTHERGEPAFIACNGKLYRVDASNPYETKEEQLEKQISILQTQLDKHRGVKGEGGLGALFG